MPVPDDGSTSIEVPVIPAFSGAAPPPPHGGSPEHGGLMARNLRLPPTPLLPRLLTFLGSAALVLGVGIAAFLTARMLGSRRAGPPPTAGADAVVETVHTPAGNPILHVTSEPEGAQITVDDRATSFVTPADVAMPRSDGSVWIRVSLDGHAVREREVDVSAGEATFRLEPQEKSR